MVIPFHWGEGDGDWKRLDCSADLLACTAANSSFDAETVLPLLEGEGWGEGEGRIIAPQHRPNNSALSNSIFIGFPFIKNIKEA
jgi:hypothetical protein